MPISKKTGSWKFLSSCPLMSLRNGPDYGEFVPGAGGTLLVFIPAAGALFGAGVLPDSESFFWQPAKASALAMMQIVMTVFMPLLV
jgi:hypothetical protein